ncbi:peroxiredoxin [Lacimicrobium alkaliphilum]|uniref:Glutathione-dependent peroxiredoxin n=1 Tax=Lacimicrobium alkaliphilum TaxID=1526571 RepID=A0ABQ1RA67_9ALTE|nr:peroxiredoxin [Lacimicrobium alkaliphilum]GGD59971.1 peroxiredoxin [Lacimicrobium alkaliphilum]
MIQPGQSLPDMKFSLRVDGESKEASTADLFAGKKVVLFAVPGPFTPTCSESHLPGYVTLADKIKAEGVDTVICTAVSDAFVMEAWSKDQNAGELLMLADGDASFAKALGMDMDTGAFGGVRSKRYSMLVVDGKVEKVNLEEPGKFEVSDAQTMLEQLS